MTLNKTIQYQFMQLLTPFAWYFGAVLVWNVLFNLVIASITEGTFSSYTSITFFFVALFSYLGFGTRLKMLLQNGVSRNSIFWSACIVVVVLSIACILCNIALELANTGKLETSNIFGAFYRKDDPLFDTLWWTSVYIFFGSATSMIAVLMYRIGTRLRILVWMAVPVWFVLCLVFENVRKISWVGIKYVLGLHNVDVISVDSGVAIFSSASLGGEVHISIAMLLGLSLVLWATVYALMKRVVVIEH